MSRDHSSIHEFEFDLICEYYSSIEREGPGCPEVTRKALSFIDHLNGESWIADIGGSTLDDLQEFVEGYVEYYLHQLRHLSLEQWMPGSFFNRYYDWFNIGDQVLIQTQLLNKAI